MSLNEKFQQAATKVRQFTRKPTDADLLEFYALYKQATVGDCNTAKPTDPKAQAKWNAWQARAGLGQDAAKTAYIARTAELSLSYA